MSCNTCSKNIKKTLGKNLKLPVECSTEDLIKAWITSHSKLLTLINIYNEKAIPDKFIQETQLMLNSFDLVTYLKKIAKSDNKAVNLLCIMAYCGLLKASEDDDVWLISQINGNTVAHWAAKGGHLTVPYGSELWRIKGDQKRTPAHWAAKYGFLNDSYESDLWYIKDYYDQTPAHWAAISGYFDAPYNSDLWCIQNFLGETPAHWAAKSNHLKAPYDSNLWIIRGIGGQTPAHLAAMSGFLNAPYELDLWLVKDDIGRTPAHWAAEGNFLTATYDSNLWRIQDKYGKTPAHYAARNGLLRAPYDSDLWYIKDSTGQTPAHLAAENGYFNAPFDSKLWLIKNQKGETPANLTCVGLVIVAHQPFKNLRQSCPQIKQKPRNALEVLGYIKLLASSKKLRKSNDIQYIDCQVVTQDLPIEHCRPDILLKNLTDTNILKYVTNDKNMLDVYITCLSVVLKQLLIKDWYGTVNILRTKNKDNAYSESSIVSRLSDTKIMEYIMKCLSQDQSLIYFDLKSIIQ